jgi:hypothetical protein
MSSKKESSKTENFCGYLFTLAVSVAMAAGSLTQALGIKGFWIPTVLWVNSALWVGMSVYAVVILYRYLLFLGVTASTIAVTVSLIVGVGTMWLGYASHSRSLLWVSVIGGLAIIGAGQWVRVAGRSSRF